MYILVVETPSTFLELMNTNRLQDANRQEKRERRKAGKERKESDKKRAENLSPSVSIKPRLELHKVSGQYSSSKTAPQKP